MKPVREKPVRDVLATAFDAMPGGPLRGYDVADRLMHALDRAGYEIVLNEEQAFMAKLWEKTPPDPLGFDGGRDA
jgi:hypothetical protein